jgi:general secretion pathway protein E
MTFATALRSLLRQDPQVIMIGEIRDAETARIAIEAALTGHFLMSTMHCGSPAAGFLRLLEMGIEPYQISSIVCAILNQRLVRRLCSKCKNKSGGCEHCLNTGYKGRAMIAELAEMNSPLRKAIAQKADIETLDEILSRQNHQNIFADGKRLVEKGITDTNELDGVLGKID